MTPPGGSRDDDADSARRRDPAPGPSGEAAPDDAPDDARAGDPGHDPRLRALRAVWLAMRDEDPPDRGLADLLAAARHKAEAMQPRPSMWQRLLAALRRPAMLALATVTVLIAGALLIGRRSSEVAAPGLTASQDGTGPVPPAAIDPGAGTRDAADRSRPTAVPAPRPTAPPPAAPPPPARSSSRPTQPTHLDMTSPASGMASPASSEISGNDGDPAAAGPGPAPAPTPSGSATPLGVSAAAADPAGGNHPRSFARPQRTEPEARPPAGASNDGRNKSQNNQTEGRNDPARGAANRTVDSAGSSAANPVVNGAAAPARRHAPAPTRADAAGDLSRQCDAAALRGDCAAVRRLVDRITRTDRGYRGRVAKDSPVAKCLAE